MRFVSGPHIRGKYIYWFRSRSRFNVKFFSQFDIVMNALDNTAARSHVNRMCLAAGVPLIESGSSGYLGNCKAILKVSGVKCVLAKDRFSHTAFFDKQCGEMSSCAESSGAPVHSLS